MYLLSIVLMTLGKKDFKTLRKKEKMLVTSIFSFSLRYFLLSHTITIISGTFCSARVAQWWACWTHDLETRLRQNFFPAYFHLSPLLKHVRKVIGGFGKKFVLVKVWESRETRVRHRPPRYDKAVKVAWNPNTTNQPISHTLFVIRKR